MVTNFFRINLPFESFHIQRVPYSEQQFAALRKEHNRDASFFRNADFIYISPRKDAGLELGESTTLNVSEAPPVVLSLIRHLVFRSFRQAFPDRIPQSFSPLRFFSTKNEHDAVRHLLPPDLKGRVCYPRMVEVEARQIVEEGRPTFGLLIRSRQRWQFNISLRELLANGFELIGRSVLETQPIPGLEGILAPDETLLGEIIAIHGNEAEITTNDGVIRTKLDSLLLQRTPQQIGTYLAFKLGEQKATRLFQNLREDRRDRERPDVFFTEAKKFAAWFSGSNAHPRVYENDDGFCFTVTGNSSFEGSSVPLHRTNLVFDYGPGASAPSPLAGLANFGPFNAARFERNDLRVLALFHPQSRGAMTQFLKLLIRWYSRKHVFPARPQSPFPPKLRGSGSQRSEKLLCRCLRRGNRRGREELRQPGV